MNDPLTRKLENILASSDELEALALESTDYFTRKLTSIRGPPSSAGKYI